MSFSYNRQQVLFCVIYSQSFLYETQPAHVSMTNTHHIAILSSIYPYQVPRCGGYFHIVPLLSLPVSVCHSHFLSHTFSMTFSSLFSDLLFSLIYLFSPPLTLYFAFFSKMHEGNTTRQQHRERSYKYRKINISAEKDHKTA